MTSIFRLKTEALHQIFCSVGASIGAGIQGSGLVIGFQYKGKLSVIKNNTESKLTTAGITGISDEYKIFKNSAGIGTVLIYFTEIGFAHVAAHPANELFNLTVSLDDIFNKTQLATKTKMFTVEQIKSAHAQVKSGADFPAYIREIKKLGVTHYETFVTNGHTDYHGVNDYKISCA